MTMRNDQIPNDCLAVTPSDSTEVGFVGLYVGGAGNVAIKTQGAGSSGTAVTLSNVPAGSIIPLAVCRVMATNTTATNIVGFVP